MKPLIVFEGLDGCGKTTIAKRFAESVGGAYTFEPSDGVVGKLIRDVLAGRARVSTRALAALFAADRAEHVSGVILPALEERVVTCDRFYMSNMAYQGATDAEMADVLAVNRLLLPPGFRPDITVFVDVPPKECMRRINADATRGGAVDIYEREGRLSDIRDGYERAIKLLRRQNENILEVDGTGGADEVYERVRARLM